MKLDCRCRRFMTKFTTAVAWRTYATYVNKRGCCTGCTTGVGRRTIVRPIVDRQPELSIVGFIIKKNRGAWPQFQSINQSINLFDVIRQYDKCEQRPKQKTSTNTKADEVCTNRCPNRKICTTKMPI